MNNRSIISGVDWWTIILFIIIALFGWMNIYGSSYSFDQTSIWDFSNRAGKQLVWLATAVLMGSIILMIEEQAYDVLGYIFYGVMIFLLFRYKRIFICYSVLLCGSTCWGVNCYSRAKCSLINSRFAAQKNSFF